MEDGADLPDDEIKSLHFKEHNKSLEEERGKCNGICNIWKYK